MTANTALRLARYFGTMPQVWLNLQKICELRRAEIAVGRRIAAGVKPRHTAVYAAPVLLEAVKQKPSPYWAR